MVGKKKKTSGLKGKRMRRKTKIKIMWRTELVHPKNMRKRRRKKRKRRMRADESSSGLGKGAGEIDFIFKERRISGFIL